MPDPRPGPHELNSSAKRNKILPTRKCARHSPNHLLPVRKGRESQGCPKGTIAYRSAMLRRTAVIICSLGTAFALDPAAQRLSDRYWTILVANPTQTASLERLWTLYEKQGESAQLVDLARQRAQDAPLLSAQILALGGHRDEAIKLIEPLAATSSAAALLLRVGRRTRVRLPTRPGYSRNPPLLCVILHFGSARARFGQKPGTQPKPRRPGSRRSISLRVIRLCWKNSRNPLLPPLTGSRPLATGGDRGGGFTVPTRGGLGIRFPRGGKSRGSCRCAGGSGKGTFSPG